MEDRSWPNVNVNKKFTEKIWDKVLMSSMLLGENPHLMVLDFGNTANKEKKSM